MSRDSEREVELCERINELEAVNNKLEDIVRTAKDVLYAHMIGNASTNETGKRVVGVLRRKLIKAGWL